jgi:glutathione S-transferase
MNRLTHFRLCAHSRSIRLALAETGIAAELVEERPWEQRPEFLALNPAGDLPVLALPGGPVLCGTYAISEYMAEELRQHPIAGPPLELFPGDREDRAEIRRLVDWFHGKFHREVTQELSHEKLPAGLAGDQRQAPDPHVLRAVRANLRYHLSYIGFLAHQRRWLAGDELSFADLAAAAHLSVVDYLDEMPWDEFPAARTWYARLKSRPSFRPLLADRIPGLPPPVHYTDLDF